MRVFFFSSTGLGGCRLFAKKHRSRARLSLTYRYKPLARHLESGDDPGDEYKRYNLAPKVLSLSGPGKLILNKNLATKVPTIEYSQKKILISLRLPELLLVRQI